MKFIIKHEIRGRLRIHVVQGKMTCAEADILFWYLDRQSNITDVKVYERTADAVICYTGERAALIRLLKSFRYEDTAVPETVVCNSGRKLNTSYKEKLIAKVLLHYGGRLLMPATLRAGIVTLKSLKYLAAGLRCIRKGKIEVPLLDATAIGVSVLRRDFNTAGSVMFLLGVGELLEEWTHKKSVGDLARSMSLNIKKVWLKRDGQEILVKADQIRKGDVVTVHMGNVIPFDGEVSGGEGMVNQVSLTGEAMPVRRVPGQSVYAGTVVEEGELDVRVKAVSGSTRFEKIVAMIEDSENGEQGGASGRQAGAVYTAWNGRGMAPDQKRDKGIVRAHGGLFLRPEACHAPDCAVGDPGGRRVRDHCKRREIPGSGRGSGHRGL